MAINQSNLPTSRVFKFEDYPGAETWFAQFLQSLNLFVSPVYDVLNGGITYQNLMIPKTYSQVITTPTAGVVEFNFKNPLRLNPTAVIIGNIYKNGQPSNHPSSATCAYWHFSQGSIYIDDIPNLTASTTYAVTLVVL